MWPQVVYAGLDCSILVEKSLTAVRNQLIHEGSEYRDMVRVGRRVGACLFERPSALP